MIDQIGPENPIYAQELFGPMASVYVVPSNVEAVRLANDTPFGLGAAIFSADVEKATRMAREIDSGMVFINNPTWIAPNMPFGGTKRSGYGRELSEMGFTEFVNRKLIKSSSQDTGASVVSSNDIGEGDRHGFHCRRCAGSARLADQRPPL